MHVRYFARCHNDSALINSVAPLSCAWGAQGYGFPRSTRRIAFTIKKSNVLLVEFDKRTSIERNAKIILWLIVSYWNAACHDKTRNWEKFALLRDSWSFRSFNLFIKTKWDNYQLSWCTTHMYLRIKLIIDISKFTKYFTFTVYFHLFSNYENCYHLWLRNALIFLI